MSGVADETHVGAFVAVTTEVLKEGLRGSVARAEARRPEYVSDSDSVRVLALVAGERASTVLLDQFLAVLY